MKKQTIIFSSILIVSIVLSFFLGILYSKNTSKNNMISASSFQKNMAVGYGFSRSNLRMGSGNMVDGEILSKDDSSLTIKLKDGGSKIIIFSKSTNVLKSSQAKIDDINVGDEVVVSGKTNSDGSVTADSIQLRNQLTPKPDNTIQ